MPRHTSQSVCLHSSTGGELEGPEQRLYDGQMVRSWPVPALRVYYQRLANALRVLRIYHHSRRQSRSRTALLQCCD